MEEVTIEQALAAALADLVKFVDARPPNATEDDDVRALEGVAFELGRVVGRDRERLRSLLGPEVSKDLFGPPN